MNYTQSAFVEWLIFACYFHGMVKCLRRPINYFRIYIYIFHQNGWMASKNVHLFKNAHIQYAGKIEHEQHFRKIPIEYSECMWQCISQQALYSLTKNWWNILYAQSIHLWHAHCAHCTRTFVFRWSQWANGICILVRWRTNPNAYVCVCVFFLAPTKQHHQLNWKHWCVWNLIRKIGNNLLSIW